MRAIYFSFFSFLWAEGADFGATGFEYWADPGDRLNNFITWQVDGTPTYQLGASAMGPDTGPDGSQVGQRLIPEEPMSIILNLGISRECLLSLLSHDVATDAPRRTANWQTIDLATMIFPAELRFDYVRVYQRKGSTNIGCDPKAYPTADYINNHIEAYMSEWRGLFFSTCAMLMEGGQTRI